MSGVSAPRGSAGKLTSSQFATLTRCLCRSAGGCLSGPRYAEIIISHLGKLDVAGLLGTGNLTYKMPFDMEKYIISLVTSNG